MVKVGAIIQVRLGSERLPNKALLPLPFSGGPALLEHVVNRAKAAKSVATVVVATTGKATDDAICTFCERKQVICFRGPEKDVLDRFYEASKMHELDVVVRLTGDNPFIMATAIDDTVEKHLAKSVDYSITEGLPLGTNIEVISYQALKQAAKESKEAADREHVTPYIRRGEQFKRQSIQYSSPLASMRLTVDYSSDYALANLLYDKLYEQGSLFTNKDLENLFQEHPWLSNVNAMNQQRQAFASEVEEFKSAARVLQEGGYERVLQKLQEVKK